MADIRITDEEVREIIDVPSSLTLTPFIRIAHRVVEDHLFNNAAVTNSLSTETLKEIELWLAAHFAAIRDQRRGQENIGKASVGYQYWVGKDLRNTMYGQQALVLDHTGTLSKAGAPKTSVSLSWLGKTDAELELD